MGKTGKLDKLAGLETKIAEAVEKAAALRSRCRLLEEKNADLKDRLAGLKEDHSSLSEQVGRLESAASDGVGPKQILDKIDRMLEKFGELQI